MAKPLTGRKVLAITVAFFGVVIAVNLVMADRAISTFPGLEVANSYVASQRFNAEKKAQLALGWKVDVAFEGNTLVLAITDAGGQPVEVAKLDARLGRATEAKDDQIPGFVFRDGAYVAPMSLDYGNWELRLRLTAKDGTIFRQTRELLKKG